MPGVPANCWHKRLAGQYDAQHPREQVRDLCTGLCETGFGGPGGRLAPRLASQGRGVTPGPAAVPRACRQGPVARPRRTEAQGGRPAPDPGAGATAGVESHQCDQGPWRPEGAGSDLWVCARVTLQAASRPLDSPSGALPGTAQISAPHDIRRVPSPRLPYPANEALFALNPFSCET